MEHDDYRPEPEPGGALVPPTRHPPTAVGIATPPPPRPPRALPAPRRRGGLFALLGAVIDTTLDAADRAGDAIAQALGLRGADPRGPGAAPP